ncbi:unnamed protein product [Phytophthora lilii]|uniref:Unnamed protein product n=1 Tax=Phytophthora lilii TaxID=2077276 RepID=A0A9W6UBZ6_9STRA|nr:unnamed protein product [Phytophthora lilii]
MHSIEAAGFARDPSDWFIAKHDVYGARFREKWAEESKDDENADLLNLSALDDALDDINLVESRPRGEDNFRRGKQQLVASEDVRWDYPPDRVATCGPQFVAQQHAESNGRSKNYTMLKVQSDDSENSQQDDASPAHMYDAKATAKKTNFLQTNPVPPPSSPVAKILFLDGVRGTAVIFVVTQHTRYMHDIFMGAVGVDAFFVLSSL